MGLLNRITKLVSRRHQGGPHFLGNRARRWGIEPLEPRQLLAADLHVGAVYFEEATGDDSAADTIEVSFVGGAEGTQLTRLVIDGDKKDNGRLEGDVFFDIAPGGLGAFKSVGLSIDSHVGFDVTGVTLVDGGSSIAFDLSGFEAGEKLVFSIDVDEISFIELDGSVDATSVAEGGEFERSRLTADFVAPHYHDATINATFWDAFDDDFAAAATAAGGTLGLHNDAYQVDHDLSDRTAGAVGTASQAPLPIEISGTVFVDMDLDNTQDAGDPGLPGVDLSLWMFDAATDSYVNTGRTTTTDAAGDYAFTSEVTAILPGRFEIREAQPTGYFSVGATAGTINGATEGVVLDVNTISQIDLVGGQNSVDNDFAEALPASLSGHVYHDADNDGLFDASEHGIGGVTIHVIPVSTIDGSSAVVSLTTDASGFYQATGLAPGVYRVVETAQPAGYLDGLDAAGKVSGVFVGAAVNPGDAINGVSLASGESGVDYDFGEILPSSISGRVHASTDGDCEVDPGDILLGGVQIDLLDASGVLLKTTQTGADGRYSFNNLAPGKYQVVEHQPSGYYDGDEHVGSAGGQVAGDDHISQIMLTSGTNGVNYDFCENVGVNLSGYVYHDADDDGVFDANEDGIGGVTVKLLDAAGNPTGATTTTDSAGHYVFTNLAAGTYGVAETQPAGWLDGKDTAGNRGGAADSAADTIRGAVLAWGLDGEDYNFGELLPSRISGRVHASTDGDCEVDPGDILLEGVQIDLLDASGVLLKTTQTGADGRYSFNNLTPGEYQVIEHQPSGYYDGDEHVGSAGGQVAGDDHIEKITLTSGTNGVNYDFCEQVGVDISGYVYHDRDNDGLFDPGETGIAGVTVKLLDAAGNPTGATTTTDSAGHYVFTNLAAGTYGVAEMQPTAWLDGKDTAGNRGGLADSAADTILGAVLTWGLDGENYNFGELLPSSISGRVHASTDGDCEVDPGDILLEGVQIDLLDASGVLLETTQTGADGRYSFNNLTPGEYQVIEHQPAEFLDGDEHVGSAGGQIAGDDHISQITLTSGTNGVNYDFCEQVGVDISGYVYHDRDNDGLFDADEAGIGGVTVKLLDAAGAPTGMTTTTDAAGYYEFTDLTPGMYGVMESQPAGWLDGKDTPGDRGGAADSAADTIRGAVLALGQDGRNYNFGELLPGSIAGRVHADRDGDCVLDENETPLADVEIELLNAAGDLVATTTTDADGLYVFTGLTPGEYRVRELQPSGYFHGDQHVGSGGGVVLGEDDLGQIEVGSDEDLTDYNFCEVPPASISGYVFQDGAAIVLPGGSEVDDLDIPALRDGSRSNDDTPLAGVVLELRHGATGLAIDAGEALPGAYSDGPIRILTDSSGFYQFDALRPGSYAVYEIQPANLLDGVDTVGTEGGVAVNPHQSPNPAILQLLAENPHNDAIIRIPLAAGQHSRENNFSEVDVKQIVIPPPEEPEPLPPTPPFVNISQPLPSAPAPRAIVLDEPNPYSGSALMSIAYTWHLSVVDAGRPRSIHTNDLLVQMTGTRFTEISWHGELTPQAEWTLLQIDQQANEAEQSALFGDPRAIPVTGDWDGDGKTEVGVFIDGYWYLDMNGNRRWDEGDLWASLGDRGDHPVTGDWDGDGKTDIGIFGPIWTGDPRAIQRDPGIPDPNNAPNGRWKNVPPAMQDAALKTRAMKLTSSGKVRADLIDHVFAYGEAGDTPLTGDWNGDGIDTIGVFRDGMWIVDSDGDGRLTGSDRQISMGQAGDKPLVGDWDGDGVDQLGLYRNGLWLLDTNGDFTLDAHDHVFQHAGEGMPVVGDWDGDGREEPGIFHGHSEQTVTSPTPD